MFPTENTWAKIKSSRSVSHSLASVALSRYATLKDPCTVLRRPRPWFKVPCTIRSAFHVIRTRKMLFSAPEKGSPLRIAVSRAGRTRLLRQQGCVNEDASSFLSRKKKMLAISPGGLEFVSGLGRYLVVSWQQRECHPHVRHQATTTSAVLSLMMRDEYKTQT